MAPVESPTVSRNQVGEEISPEVLVCPFPQVTVLVCFKKSVLPFHSQHPQSALQQNEKHKHNNTPETKAEITGSSTSKQTL